MRKVLLFTFIIFALNSIHTYAQKPTDIAIKFLEENQKRFGWTAADLEELELTDSYTSKHNGVQHVYFKQFYKGIEVQNGISNVNISFEGKALNVNNRFVSDLKNKVNSINPSISAETAIIEAGKHLDIFRNQEITLLSSSGDANQSMEFSSDLSDEIIKIKLVFAEALDHSTVRLAWDLKILLNDVNDHWSMRIDAMDGKVLEQNNLVIKCSFGPRAHSEKSCNSSCASNLKTTTSKTKNFKEAPIVVPFKSSSNTAFAANDYNIFPMPVESPIHGERAIVNSPWLDAGDASPLGWHDDGLQQYTITRGNNVFAKEDLDDNNEGGYSPQSDNLDFNFELDLLQAPEDHLDVAITNLFYWCNIMHDVWYNYGFDEASGNFQNNNRGLGGLGNDHIRAEAQDGSGLDNANFSSQEDGSNARIQMFLWSVINSPLTAVIDINSPSNIAGNAFLCAEAIWAPEVEPGLLTAKIILVDDGSSDGSEGCDDLENSNSLEGRIALAEKSGCNIAQKAVYAQEAGAIALIVINTANGNPSFMGVNTTGTDIEIPVLLMSNEDGEMIKDNLLNSVNASLNENWVKPFLDSSFDNGIICHEYGHGISGRLSGGPSSAQCLISDEQMGEGWSDWFGLMLTMKESDTREMGRGIGTYVEEQAIDGPGIRPARYSTDTLLNDFTYFNSRTESVPHGVGFVWATILWEMTWDLIDEYGFDSDFYAGDGGNNLAMQLVIDGLKLGPCNPGMVDGRDAILLADRINNDGANQCLIWEAFARKGLGYSADQGSHNSRSDQEEAFDLPPSCKVLSFEFEAANDSVPKNEMMAYDFKIMNRTDDVVNNILVSSMIPEHTEFVSDSCNCDFSIEGDQLHFNFAEMEAGQTLNCQFYLQANYPNHTQSIFKDDNESGTEAWESYADSSNLQWTISDDAFSGNNAWFASDHKSNDQLYLELDETFELSGDNNVLQFYHKYNTRKGWDAGVIEYSINDGNEWTLLDKENFILNPYNSEISPTPGLNEFYELSFNNTYLDQLGFSGKTQGYVSSMVDLNFLEGESVKLRFIKSNTEGSFKDWLFLPLDGWYLDDVQLLDAVFLDISASMTSSLSDTSVIRQISLVTDTLVSPYEVCIAYNASITSSVSTDNGLIVAEQGNIADFSYSTFHSEAIPNNYSTLLFISNADENSSIVEQLEDGNINVRDYNLGEYLVWALTYGETNDNLSLEDFLTENNIESISELEDFINHESVCLSLTNKDADGNSMRINIRSITGLDDLRSEIQEILISPNPVDAEISLSFTSKDAQALSLQIIDIGGKVLTSENIEVKSGSNQFKLESDHLAEGSYLLNLIDKKGRTVSYKFVKTR